MVMICLWCGGDDDDQVLRVVLGMCGGDGVDQVLRVVLGIHDGGPRVTREPRQLGGVGGECGCECVCVCV